LNEDIPSLYFGPWYQRETVITTVDTGGETKIFIHDICTKLSDGVDIDSKWKTARAFSVMAPLFGGLLSIILWIAPCMGRFQDDKVWKQIAMLYCVIITLFQGLTFLIFMDGSACDANTPLYGSSNSDTDALLEEVYPDGCEWGGGSTANAVSTGLWFLTGVAMIILGAPKEEPRPPPETQEVTYQRTENPDGSHTVNEVNVIKGTALPQQQPEEPIATPEDKQEA
jgi:hypothetical protein